MHTEALVATASPIIASVGAGHFSAPTTIARTKELGLKGRQFYYLGRGSALGDVEWQVVASAYGFFPPRLVEEFWNSARLILPARQAAPIYAECVAEFGRANFSELDGLQEYCTAAELIVTSAEKGGLVLFAALLTQALAEDLPGRAAQLTTILREHRGSAHLAAVAAVGLEPRVADAVNSEQSWRAHGWTEQDGPPPTEPDAHLRIQAEELTNRVVNKAFAVLTEDEGLALLNTLRAMQEALQGPES